MVSGLRRLSDMTHFECTCAVVRCVELFWNIVILDAFALNNLTYYRCGVEYTMRDFLGLFEDTEQKLASDLWPW